MEEFTNEQSSKLGQVKRWFQDNLRIIVSVVIVAAIAGGIYSYSKRVAAPVATDEKVSEQVAGDETTAQISGEETKKEEVAGPKSQETESSFIESAGKGDSRTVLARRALANYLEKNTDSQLTAEHKIYIEDYLRKNVDLKGGVKVGTSIEFSKDLIKKSIEQSKKLNEKQLNNLKQYSSRVSSLK